jgi:hypothetical protein
MDIDREYSLATHANVSLFIFCSRRKNVGSAYKSQLSGFFRLQALTRCLFLTYQQEIECLPMNILMKKQMVVILKNLSVPTALKKMEKHFI